MLGLDVGGANLKASIPALNVSLQMPFALWRDPQQLSFALESLFSLLPSFDRIAATMTGELCDCFASKREGTRFILDALEEASPRAPIAVWSADGRFLTVSQARQQPLLVAAANWHGLATWVGQRFSEGAVLLIDVGSTTTDVIPIWNGKPVPQGRTDPDRMRSNELVYLGARRTPVCAVLGMQGAAELFATMQDVFLILADLAEDEDDCDTADGRPATLPNAHRRLARTYCADLETSTSQERIQIAETAQKLHAQRIGDAIDVVASRSPKAPKRVVLSGAGEFCARRALMRSRLGKSVEVVSLNERLTSRVSMVACAFAIARLAEDLE